MKTIIFDSVERYEILYEALVAPSDFGFKGNQTRLISKILDKIESIGKLKAGDDGKLGLYTMNFVNNKPEIEYPSLDFEDPEFELIISKFDSVPWLATGARRAAKVYDYLVSLRQ